MKKLRKTEGITLVALVITIIILLILAGITINALTNSGLLGKAEEAKLKYTEVQIKEQIEMVVINSMINSTGDIDLEELEKGLLKINGVTEDSIEKKGEDEKLPWIVTVEDWKFEIDENGEVKVVKGISIPKNLKIVEGSTETIIATLMSGITGEINWRIEDNNIAKLSSTTGNSIEVKAQAISGSTIIIASVITENGVTYSSECVLTIIQKVTAISVKDLKIHTGGTGKIVVEREPKDVEVEDFKYESKNLDIVTVDENGVVTGLKEGTAKIAVTGKVSGISSEGNIQVTGLAVGDYVLYDVTYTDMGTSGRVYDNSGNGKYGWRILDLGEFDEESETYSGVKIISSGLPARISFMNTNSGTASWFGSGSNYKERASWGMLNNFANIPYVNYENSINVETTKHIAISYPNPIINLSPSDVISSDNMSILLTKYAKSVKSIEIWEHNTIYKVIDSDLEIDSNKNGFITGTPSPSTYGLYQTSKGGGSSYGPQSDVALRPVITLIDGVTIKNSVGEAWIIEKGKVL